mmetsp:Transcript_33103/g.103222  ORF Transcript_33103/g.103222 Transcript_33103/m.103222 type:complete len:215 (-) Transcript_33103:2395-3039(-)
MHGGPGKPLHEAAGGRGGDRWPGPGASGKAVTGVLSDPAIVSIRDEDLLHWQRPSPRGPGACWGGSGAAGAALVPAAVSPRCRWAGRRADHHRRVQFQLVALPAGLRVPLGAAEGQALPQRGPLHLRGRGAGPMARGAKHPVADGAAEARWRGAHQRGREGKPSSAEGPPTSASGLPAPPHFLQAQQCRREAPTTSVMPGPPAGLSSRHPLGGL